VAGFWLAVVPCEQPLECAINAIVRYL